MEVLKYLKECERMCNSFDDCISCPAFKPFEGTCCISDIFEDNNKEQSVFVVEA